MLNKTHKRILALAVPLFAVTVAAPAAQLSGTLTFNPVNGIIVTGNSINFDNSLNGTPGYGLFDIATGSTGSFLPYVGQQGNIKDLNQTQVPVGANVNVPDFLILPTTTNNIHFVLTSLDHGVFSTAQCSADPTQAAAGQTCTPDNFALGGQSALNLINLSSSSFTASFKVEGYAYNGTTADGFSPFVGTFATSFSNESYQQALKDLMTNGFVQTQASAQGTFSVTFVPEPATLSMMLLGGAGVLIGSFRRKSRKA